MPSIDDGTSSGHEREQHKISTGGGLDDDFDDFEAQVDDDDFGEFDEGFEQSSTAPEPAAPEMPSFPKSLFVSSTTYIWSSIGLRSTPPVHRDYAVSASPIHFAPWTENVTVR